MLFESTTISFTIKVFVAASKTKVSPSSGLEASTFVKLPKDIVVCGAIVTDETTVRSDLTEVVTFSTGLTTTDIDIVYLVTAGSTVTIPSITRVLIFVGLVINTS
jgi:hypothetical protein